MSTPTPAPSAGSGGSTSGPDHLDLYLIVVGILAGVLLGPAVLGWINPQRYERASAGGLAERLDFEGFRAKQLYRFEAQSPAELAAFDIETRRELDNLKATGASEQASAELGDKRDQQRQTLEKELSARHAELLAEGQQKDLLWKAAQGVHQEWLRGLMQGLMIAVVVVMVIETLVNRDAGAFWLRAAGRLATVRYALFAVWIAVLLAQPALLRGIDPVFVALVLVVGVAVAVVPLGKRRQSR